MSSHFRSNQRKSKTPEGFQVVFHRNAHPGVSVAHCPINQPHTDKHGKVWTPMERASNLATTVMSAMRGSFTDLVAEIYTWNKSGVRVKVQVLPNQRHFTKEPLRMELIRKGLIRPTTQFGLQFQGRV